VRVVERGTLHVDPELGASLGANVPPLVPLDLQIQPQDSAFSQVTDCATACSRFRFQPVGVSTPLGHTGSDLPQMGQYP